MTFNNISWSGHESINSDKIKKMVENDNLNYTLATQAPSGLLGVYNLAPSTASGYKFIQDDYFRLITQLNIYNKNYIKNNQPRYFRIKISDFLIQDNDTSGNALTGSNGIQQGVVLRFAVNTATGEDPSALDAGVELFEFVSMLKPYYLSGATYLSRPYFKYQAGEITFASQVGNLIVNIYALARSPRYSAGTLKDPVKCATTASITLSGTQTVDGVATIIGDRVLVKNQGSSLNGIYEVRSGAWFKTGDATLNAQADVQNGTQNKGKSFYVSSYSAIPASVVWTEVPNFIAHSNSFITVEDIGTAPVA